MLIKPQQLSIMADEKAISTENGVVTGLDVPTPKSKAKDSGIRVDDGTKEGGILTEELVPKNLKRD